MILDSNEQEVTPGELQRRQQWADILSELRAAPISILLRAYLTELEKRSPSWGIDVFVEGIQRFANFTWAASRTEFSEVDQVSQGR